MPASLTPWPETDREPQEVEKSPNGRYIRYNILLGKGACKRVYKALDTEEGLEVAWNQVDLLGMDRDEEARLHLQEEIRVLQQLKHKNIMTFYAWWYDKSNLHINFITELFTSGNLRQYRKKLKMMSENVLKRWAHQILEGLLYLHGHTPPIVHRDLKCDNIFVNSATGEVKIGDLGLATAQQTAMSVVGTPEFMAPEVYDESYDERCDIYSFGMCLLELTTLEYPYAECRNVPQIFKKVTLGVPPASLSRVSPELRELISLCIAHNPADRPTARELLKHPYLEAVRLGCSESGPVLPSGGSFSAVGVAPMSTGGGSNGWNTPSCTVQCAASVRDLREALHQQEALARHHQYHHQYQLQHLHQASPYHHQYSYQLQQQQQQQQLLHSSCPDVHAVAVEATAAAAVETSADGCCGGDGAPLPREMLRSNSVAIAELARGTSNDVITISGKVPPLDRATMSSYVRSPPPPSYSDGGAAAALTAVTATAGAVGAAVSTPSMTSSMASIESDTDSDEEVLVPIELLKAGLLEEGFVDPEAAATACETSDAGCDSSTARFPVDHTLTAIGMLRQPSAQSSQPSAAEAAAVVFSASRKSPSHGSQTVQRQRQHRSPRMQPIQSQTGEGEGEGAREQQQQQRQRRLARQPEEASYATVSTGPSGACKTTAEGECSAHEGEDGKAQEELNGELEVEEGKGEVEGGGSGGGEEVSLDPARLSNGDGDAAAEAACSLASSLSSGAAKLLLYGASSGSGGRHTRQSSPDAVTFNPLPPPGASGASTPALRLSYSGAAAPSPPSQPPTPPQLQQPALTSPVDMEPTSSLSPSLSCLTSFSSAGMPVAVGAVEQPTQLLRTRGSAPSHGGSSNAGMVRLPSFRNRVVLTLQTPHGAPIGGSCGGGGGRPPLAPYVRSTSARLDAHSVGGGAGAGIPRTPHVPSAGYPSAPSGWGTAAVPGYCSLGGGAMFRRDMAADADAAAEAANAFDAIDGVPGAAAEAAVRHKEEGVSVAEISQSVPLRRLPGVPESDSGSMAGVCNGTMTPPLAVNTIPPLGNWLSSSDGDTPVEGPGGGGDGTAVPAVATTGQLSNVGDAGTLEEVLDVTSAITAACDGRAAAVTPSTMKLAEGLASHPPGQHDSELPVSDVTLIKEVSRPIQGVIMRLKQWKRLMKDRAKGRRTS